MIFSGQEDTSLSLPTAPKDINVIWYSLCREKHPIIASLGTPEMILAPPNNYRSRMSSYITLIIFFDYDTLLYKFGKLCDITG
jgi:hypothetical protein